MKSSPFTIREDHPTGVTVVTAAVLTPIILWIANLIGVPMDAEVAGGLAILLIAIPAVYSSWKHPRIQIPDLPVDPPADRGITPAPVDDVKRPDTAEGDLTASGTSPPAGGSDDYTDPSPPGGE